MDVHTEEFSIVSTLFPIGLQNRLYSSLWWCGPRPLSLRDCRPGLSDLLWDSGGLDKI